MGIFDDEKERMADEAAAAGRSEEQRKAELRQVAHKVGEDLINYMARNPCPHSIDISVDENVINLRKITTSDTMEIKCNGRGSFEISINGKLATSTDRGQMARGVMDWLDR